jgi:WD40 repeat protein
LRAWRVADGALLYTLDSGYSRPTFSPDGMLLATIRGSRASLWRLSDGALLHTLDTEDSWQIGDLAFSADGATLYTINQHPELRRWRVDDGQLLGTFLLKAPSPTDAAFSPDGSVLALTSHFSPTVWLWDPRQPEYQEGRFWPLRALEGHEEKVRSLQFSPDGAWLAAGAYGGQAYLWRIEDGARLGTFDGLSRETPLAFSSDSARLAMAAESDQCSLQVRQVPDGGLVHTLNLCVDPDALAFSRDGELLAAAVNDSRYDEYAYVWRLSDSHAGAIFGGLDQREPRTLVFSADGRTLFVATWIRYSYKRQGETIFSSIRGQVEAWPVDR